jgi:hypothetical protein
LNTSDWSLPKLLAGLHEDIEQRLSTVRKTLAHPGTKGDASEKVWIDLLETYLPQRYETATAYVVDSNGAFSDQIDVLVFDRQYSPFIFHFQGETIVPAESVYAAFEAKQIINAENIKYAQEKVASVRRLARTTLPIPSAGGVLPARTLPHIWGGLITFESSWNPALGQPLIDALTKGAAKSRLDLGCVATRGIFSCDTSGCFTVTLGGKPATAFLFELIARLQSSATAPMIDIRAYGRWLDIDKR